MANRGFFELRAQQPIPGAGVADAFAAARDMAQLRQNQQRIELQRQQQERLQKQLEHDQKLALRALEQHKAEKAAQAEQATQQRRANIGRAMLANVDRMTPEAFSRVFGPHVGTPEEPITFQSMDQARLLAEQLVGAGQAQGHLEVPKPPEPTTAMRNHERASVDPSFAEFLAKSRRDLNVNINPATTKAGEKFIIDAADQLRALNNIDQLVDAAGGMEVMANIPREAMDKIQTGFARVDARLAPSEKAVRGIQVRAAADVAMTDFFNTALKIASGAEIREHEEIRYRKVLPTRADIFTFEPKMAVLRAKFQALAKQGKKIITAKDKADFIRSVLPSLEAIHSGGGGSQPALSDWDAVDQALKEAGGG